MTLEKRISQLEDQKWKLIICEDIESPILMEKIKRIDKKLNKLYAWLANGYMGGMVLNNELFY